MDSFKYSEFDRYIQSSYIISNKEFVDTLIYRTDVYNILKEALGKVDNNINELDLDYLKEKIYEKFKEQIDSVIQKISRSKKE